jgi:hypothetical protein
MAKMLELINHGKLVLFQDQQSIYEYGDKSEEFYIVIFGKVSLYSKTFSEVAEAAYDSKLLEAR